MAGFSDPLWIGMIVLRILSVHCDEHIVSIIDRIDGLNKDIVQVKERFTQHIASAKTSLRLELKQYTSQYVRDAIEEILQDEFSEERVSSRIINEMKKLKQGNHQMKTRVNRVLVSLEDVQGEMKTIQEAVKKSENDTNGIKECSKCFIDSETLERINQLRVQKDKETVGLKQNVTTVMTTPKTSTSKSTSVTTKMAAIRKPEEERSRIIFVPALYPKHQKLLQVNLHSGSFNNYQLRSLRFVTSIVYVSKIRKLLIGVRFPDRIISSPLDRNSIRIIRRKVGTSGMAVDEERGLIFLTTAVPRPTISSMTTSGQNFTTITKLQKYAVALSLAVNSEEKKIYVCGGNKVFTLRYDGRDMHTLVTGRNMYALTLDITGRFLYYNDEKMMKKLTLSQNSTEDVSRLVAIPWNYVFYKDTVYCSYYLSGVIGAIRVGYFVTSYTVQVMQDWDYQAICLVP